MDTDKLSFLGGNEPAEVEVVEDAPAAEVPAEAAPEPSPEAEQPRGADGKFAAKDAPKEPPLSERETVGFYRAMQDERDKRQALEKQLAEFRARETPPAPVPLEAQFEQRLYAQNLLTSRRFAESQYGKDEVALVHDWAAAKCDADPLFNQRMRSSDHPYEEAMQAFNRDKIVAEVSPGDLDAFKAWKSAQAQAAQPQPAAQAAPRSLATAPGNGAAGKAAVPVGEGQAFAGLFS